MVSHIKLKCSCMCWLVCSDFFYVSHLIQAVELSIMQVLTKLSTLGSPQAGAGLCKDVIVRKHAL